MFVEKKLPYPMVEVLSPEGKVRYHEYQIPDADRESVLRTEYPFDCCPKLDDERVDLHLGKRFLVGDFKVVRVGQMNYLVSPYYAESGATVIDWIDTPFVLE